MKEHETIRILKESLDRVRKRSIAEHSKKVDKRQLELVETISRSLIQRIVELPTVRLRQASEPDQSMQLNHTLIRLFNLEYNQTTHQKEKQS